MKNFNLDSNAKFTTRSFYVGVGWGGIQIRIQSLSCPQEVSIWGRGTGIQTQVQSLSFFYDKFNST